MKLILLVYVISLALVACLCVADQSRGLRDDQKNELSSINEVTASVWSEATSQGFDVTHDVVIEQKLSLANQVDRKLLHHSPRLHEHEGPDKVRELGPEGHPVGWIPNLEFGLCYYYLSGGIDQCLGDCCERWFPDQSPEQRSNCLRRRPTSRNPPEVGWYTSLDWGKRRCYYYDGSGCGGYCSDSSWPNYFYSTKEECCKDNYPANYVLSDGKTCTDLVGIVSNYVYYPDTMTSAPTRNPISKPTTSPTTSMPTTSPTTSKPTPSPSTKPTTSKPTTRKPTPRPTTRKPTPRPTKDCCLVCWKCKRDQKKIAEEDKAAAAAHASTPASKPTTSCMSGDTRVGSIQSINETLNNLTLFKTVRNLSVGDTIRGLDKDLNPADCLVQAIGPYGNGTVYGNYTDDHYILSPVANVVLPTGNSSVSTEVDKYSVLTSCPVGLDESGVGFTPFDSDFFGADPVSWSDYVLIHHAIVDIVKVVGPFVFSPQTYTSMEEVSEYTHAFYTTLLTCTKDPTSCDAFEMASLELVEMSMTEESRMKVGSAFPDFGQLNMPSSIAASVTNGASVIYSWVPDRTGLNKGCVSAPLGSIETYTPKYDEKSTCCSFHYNWDVATCMGANVLPPSGWYPAWTLGINKCLADGNQPEYMSKNPTQYLFPDRQACCTKHYSWSLITCLFDSDSTDLGNLQWYMDGGACVMNCPEVPEGNVDCGGLAKSWDTLWSSKEECCKKMKWWDSSCETN